MSLLRTLDKNKIGNRVLSIMVEVETRVHVEEVQFSGVQILARMVGLVADFRASGSPFWEDTIKNSRKVRLWAQQVMGIPDGQKEEVREAYRALQEVDTQIAGIVLKTLSRRGGVRRAKQLLGISTQRFPRASLGKTYATQLR